MNLVLRTKTEKNENEVAPSRACAVMEIEMVIMNAFGMIPRLYNAIPLGVCVLFLLYFNLCFDPMTRNGLTCQTRRL